MFLRRLSFLFFVFLSFFQTSLKAEVEQVILIWRAAECDAGCAALLEKEFGKISGVAAVSVDRGAGQANLKWKPDVPFSFYPINTALRMIGPRFHDLRVQVKGKIKYDVNNVKIISSGDNTEFYLLNPVIPVPNQYVETHSPFNRQLTPDLRNQLLDGSKKNLTATIEGPLFEPFRSPPLQLVVEHLSFEDPAAKKDK